MKSVAVALLVFVAMPALAIWPFDDATDETQEAYYEVGCCWAGCEEEAGSHQCDVENKKECNRLQQVAELRFAECRKDLNSMRCVAAVDAGRKQAEVECK